MKKRISLIILLAAVALSGMAQTIGEAFYIYRNDGQFNAFFRDEVLSIEYSNYDVDSVYYDEVVTQVVNTADSVYKIPLAAIDSVGFVQPETMYKEGSIPLEGELFDYLIRVEENTLVFDLVLPESLVPGVGDKLVATDITVKLPNGFVGVVKSVTTGTDGIYVNCENIELSEAVSQYYGVYEVIAGSGGQTRVRGPRRAMHENVIYNGDLPSGRKNIQLGLSGFVTEKDIFDINAKNTFDITYTPEIRIKITRVVDDLLLRSHTNLLVITDIDADVEYEVSGEAQKEWKKSFLPKQDFPIAGIPVYFDLGAKASLSGEIATAFSFKSFAHILTDITYYDVSLLPVIGSVVSPIVNRVGGDVNITTMDLEWDYLGFRAEFKPRIYARVGLSAISHVAGWVGGEFDFGIKATGELMFDVDRIRNAEPGTAVYDELKDLAKIDIKPYVGAHFMAAAFDDRYVFSLGKDFDTPLGTWYQGCILPGFSETKATALSDTRASVKAKVTNDCFIPYTVGFSLYDEDNNHIDTKIYEANGKPVKYWTRNAFKSYSCEFSGLSKEKKYKVYPVIRFLGKYDMLCSPSANLIMDFPLEYGETSCPDSNHPHWIDLGLPSGTQWRCCNEGASTPEAYGGYYTFGQVSSAPTKDQIRELLGYCSSEWTTLNGVNGRKFTGPNGGTIFLPAAGYRWNGEFGNVGSGGYYWSSTPGDEHNAVELGFGSGGAYWDGSNRYGEQSVRPVR